MNRLILYFVLLLIVSCGKAQETKTIKEKMKKGDHKYTNNLINQSSPYLLQHAHNPVNWYPWGEEAFNKAKEEDKLLLISIGYAACHWCHVTEHESFEDEKVAELMNERQKALKAAEEITQGIAQTDIVNLKEKPSDFLKDDLAEIVEPWKKYFDTKEGGNNRAPKFPLPNSYEFLLQYYYYYSKDKEALEHVILTLNKMAAGGIYDQIGGGFARYSVDAYWKVPHFEKMLYDNGQLVSLYAKTYQLTKNKEYKRIVYQTLEFIERELSSPEDDFRLDRNFKNGKSSINAFLDDARKLFEN